MSRPVFSPDLSITAAVLAISLALLPSCARAQEPVVPTAPQAQPVHSAAPQSRVEYALYVGNGIDGARIFASAISDVRGRNWRDFAKRLQAERFPDYPRTEPAFFTWLAERGWELVECERREETVSLLRDRDVVTRCHFRRVVPVSAASSTGDAEGPSR